MSTTHFATVHAVAWQKIQTDNELNVTEKTAFGRRRYLEPLPPPVSNPRRTLRARFKAFLAEFPEAADSDLQLEDFFNRNKHLGSRIELSMKIPYGHVTRSDRLRLTMKISRDTRELPLGEGPPEPDSDAIEELVLEAIDEKEPERRRKLLEKLDRAGIGISSRYLWSFPLNQRHYEQLHSLPCILGLPVDSGKSKYILVDFRQVPSCGAARPTAFDAGIFHLRGLWKPGGETQPAHECADAAKAGCEELFQRPPSVTSVTSFIPFALCSKRGTT